MVLDLIKKFKNGCARKWTADWQGGAWLEGSCGAGDRAPPGGASRARLAPTGVKGLLWLGDVGDRSRIDERLSTLPGWRIASKARSYVCYGPVMPVRNARDRPRPGARRDIQPYEQGGRARVPQALLAKNKRRSEPCSRCAARAALDLRPTTKFKHCDHGTHAPLHPVPVFNILRIFNHSGVKCAWLRSTGTKSFKEETSAQTSWLHASPSKTL